MGGRGRPWEAMGPWLAQRDQIKSGQIREPIREHGLPWPPTASHGLPEIRPPTHSASHIFSCDLSEPIRGEHGLRSGRPIGLSCTLGDAVRSSGEAARSAQGSDSHDRPAVGGRSDSQGFPHVICQRVRGGRPWEAKHGLSPQSHVICLRVRSERPKWEAEVRGHVGGRSASHAHRAKQCV